MNFYSILNGTPVYINKYQPQPWVAFHDGKMTYMEGENLVEIDASKNDFMRDCIIVRGLDEFNKLLDDLNQGNEEKEEEDVN